MYWTNHAGAKCADCGKVVSAVNISHSFTCPDCGLMNYSPDYIHDGRGVFRALQKDRNDLAQKIMTARKSFRDRVVPAYKNDGVNVAKHIDLIGGKQLLLHAYTWTMVGNFTGKPTMPMKPTADNLRKEISGLREYANRNFGPIVLGDGYALCGEEDARAERQEYAGHEADALESALNYLEGGHK